MFAVKCIFEIWGRRFTDLPSMTFFLYEALRVDSKEDVAVTMECRQEFLSAARVDHSLWSKLQALRDFLSVSLYRLFGAPLSRWPEDSLPYKMPYKMIFGKRWSFILETCPADRSLKKINMASILGVSACSRTVMFVTKSLQWMFRIVRQRRQRWWKRLRSHNYVVAVCHPGCKVGWSVQQLCTHWYWWFHLSRIILRNVEFM
jgi:hypothetical protein